MPPKSNTEKIEELREAITQLVRRSDTLETQGAHTKEQIEQGKERVVQTERLLDQLRLEMVALRQDVAELKRSRDEWGRRGWQIVAGLILALAGGVIGYLLKS